MKHSCHKGALQKPLWRILIEEGLAKSSKKQHSENTDKWHLCKACSWNANQNKTTRMNPRPHPHTPRKHSELKEPYEMLNKANTNNNS